jgi:hypothetical protein
VGGDPVLDTMDFTPIAVSVVTGAGAAAVLGMNPVVLTREWRLGALRAGVVLSARPIRPHADVALWYQPIILAEHTRLPHLRGGCAAGDLAGDVDAGVVGADARQADEHIDQARQEPAVMHYGSSHRAGCRDRGNVEARVPALVWAESRSIGGARWHSRTRHQ